MSAKYDTRRGEYNLIMLNDSTPPLIFLRLVSPDTQYVTWYEALADGWHSLGEEQGKQIEADFQDEQGKT